MNAVCHTGNSLEAFFKFNLVVIAQLQAFVSGAPRRLLLTALPTLRLAYGLPSS